MGDIPSPSWNDVVDDLIFDVSDELERTLGKGFYLEHQNPAISVLEIPHAAMIKIS